FATSSRTSTTSASLCSTVTQPNPLAGMIFPANDRHLLAAADRPVVPDDDPVAWREPLRDLGNALRFVHDPELHHRAVDRVVHDPIHERLAVLCLPDRLCRDNE